MSYRARLLIALTVSLASAPLRAFEIPLTRNQRAQKLVEEGYEQILRGDFLGAIDTCDKALSVHSDWAPAYVCRSEARLWLKDPLSDRDARQAMKRDPKSGDPFRLLGLWEFEAGHYASAIQQFNQALSLSKLKPEGVTECYHFRAKAKMKVGDYAGALQDVAQGQGVLQGVNGAYGDWSFYGLRAEILRQMGEAARADADERRVLRLVDERLKRHPFEAQDLLKRRAQADALLRDFDQAAADYGRLLSVSSADAKIMVDRALALTMSGRYGEAAFAFGRALELGDPRSSVRLMRALALAAENSHREAAFAFDSFLLGRPAADRPGSKSSSAEENGGLLDLSQSQALSAEENSETAGRQALLDELAGRHDRALREADKVLARRPHDLAAHLARAAAGALAARCAETLPSLEWLVSRQPESSFYRWLRGECREDLGNHRGALDDLSFAAAAAPGLYTLAARLAVLHRRFLDIGGPSPAAEELGRLLSEYDRVKILRGLIPAERLGRAKTMVELSERVRGKEKRRLLHEAAAEVDEVLRETPEQLDAQALRLRIGKRLGSRR